MDILKEEEITIFGKTNYRGEEKPFGIKTDDRRRHMYIIGKTGMGKSVMLRNLVVQDIIKGRGVAFVDPHGDTAEEILNFVPKSRINDVIYFNPADLENPVAFNVLEAVDEDHKHLIASGMMGVFKKIWPDVWSPRMEYILSNTILALLDYPGSTMLGINRMMADSNFRRQVIDKVRDPIVRSFWLEEFGKWDQRFAREATAAIQNKVGQFVSTPIVRHIVGQTTSTFNMRQIMDEGKILIVNLAKGRIGEESMALLGGMVVTRLYLAAMERVDMAESARRDFYLYVDEFQNFATESFASILSEARKYRLSLIVAHQYIAQLAEEVRDAVFGNVGTLVSFRVGAPDAEFLEKEFEPMVMMNDIVNLPKFQTYLKLMIDGVSGNAFSAKSLPPFSPPIASYADKVIQISQERYGRPRKEVEDKITKWMEREFIPESHERMGGNKTIRTDEYKPKYGIRNKEEGGRKEVKNTVQDSRLKTRGKTELVPRKDRKHMSPSQIIGFGDQNGDDLENKIKQEMAKVGENTAQGLRLEAKNTTLKLVQASRLPGTRTVLGLTDGQADLNQKILEKKGSGLRPEPTINEEPETRDEERGTRDEEKNITQDSGLRTQNPVPERIRYRASLGQPKAQSPKPRLMVDALEKNTGQKAEKLPTVWQEAVCDRCRKTTKIPFDPVPGRGIYCKECLREVRRQRALSGQRPTREEKPRSHPEHPKINPRGRVSEEQREKYKEDLRKMLAELKKKRD